MSASFLDQSSRHWFFKYKIYHLPFWFVYHYLWWVMALGSPGKALDSLLFLPYTVKYSFFVIFQALAVYFNLYFLIPRFLEKGRLPTYTALLLLTMLGTSLLLVSGYYFSTYISGQTLEELYGAEKESGYFFSFLATALPSTVASMTLAMSIKLTKNWIQARQRQNLLEKEKLETELKFLRNQFNPHFLFNTINSIFFLIHKNPDMASASLAKFSDLLRYQLYECNDHQIPLDKEIAYLENFIELEKLRQNSNVTINLKLDSTESGHLSIAPFVLMTFVENAFKHVSRQKDRTNWIDIRLDLEGQQLNFSVANSTGPEAASEATDSNGIGLNNVQRRLDLVYPGTYILNVQNESSRFAVELELELAESALASVVEIA